MQHLQYILYPASLTISAIGAWAIAHHGSKIGVLDRPDHRSSHHKTTPKGGGIGIVASFVLAAIFLKIPLSLWIPSALLSLVSFYGDKSDIPPAIRLLFQFMASFIVLLGIFSYTHKTPAAYLLLFPLSVFLVGTANYYNFMDGINGIAGITGALAFGFLSCYAFIFGHPTAYMVLSVCISLACLGFLPYNIPDARVFMGDVGSIFLGFLFASIVALFTHSLADFICLISFLFPFYTDELTTLAVRVRDGDKLTRPHRKHVYQLLANELNIAHWKVSAGYGALQIMVSVAALSLRPHGIIPLILLLSTFFLFFSFFSYAVRRKIAAFL